MELHLSCINLLICLFHHHCGSIFLFVRHINVSHFIKLQLYLLYVLTPNPFHMCCRQIMCWTLYYIQLINVKLSCRVGTFYVRVWRYMIQSEAQFMLSILFLSKAGIHFSLFQLSFFICVNPNTWHLSKYCLVIQSCNQYLQLWTQTIIH